MEQTVEQKLKALYELQAIHTKIDRIRQVKSLLPVEVSELEDDVSDLETRLQSSKSDLDLLEHGIVAGRNNIEEAQKNIEKYRTELSTVKNNQDHEAISKEIELQDLDIQIGEKKLREIGLEIASKTNSYNQAVAELIIRKKDLTLKVEELNNVSSETGKDESELTTLAAKAMLGIDRGLLAIYTLLRGKTKNGLAIVTVERGACSGCFNQTPTQRQSEIRQHQRIIFCEYCGRILVDENLVLETATA